MLASRGDGGHVATGDGNLGWCVGVLSSGTVADLPVVVGTPAPQGVVRLDRAEGQAFTVDRGDRFDVVAELLHLHGERRGTNIAAGAVHPHGTIGLEGDPAGVGIADALGVEGAWAEGRLNLGRGFSGLKDRLVADLLATEQQERNPSCGGPA